MHAFGAATMERAPACVRGTVVESKNAVGEATVWVSPGLYETAWMGVCSHVWVAREPLRAPVAAPAQPLSTPAAPALRLSQSVAAPSADAAAPAFDTVMHSPIAADAVMHPSIARPRRVLARALPAARSLPRGADGAEGVCVCAATSCALSGSPEGALGCPLSLEGLRVGVGAPPRPAAAAVLAPVRASPRWPAQCALLQSEPGRLFPHAVRAAALFLGAPIRHVRMPAWNIGTKSQGTGECIFVTVFLRRRAAVSALASAYFYLYLCGGARLWVRQFGKCVSRIARGCACATPAPAPAPRDCAEHIIMVV